MKQLINLWVWGVAILLSPFSAYAQDCPTEIIQNPSENCLVWGFQLNNNVMGNVMWTVDGVESFSSGPATTIDFPEPGVYTVCAELITFDCEQICIQVDVQNCASCPEGVQYSIAEDCLTVEFWWDYSGNPTEFVEMTYAFGDGNFAVTSELSQVHTYSEPGTYNLNFTFTAESCDAVVQQLTIEVGCNNNNCPDPEQFWSNAECLSAAFEIGSFQEGESVQWDFGDGSTMEGGHFIQHTYNEPGEYLVTAVYSSNDCPGETYTTSILIEDCNTDCTLEVEWLIQEDCGLYIAEAYNYPENAQIHWLVNGDLYNIGHITTFLFEENGLYEICAIYETPECPEGVEWCTTVEVGCNEGCEGNQVMMGLDSWLNQGGPSAVFWQMDNADGFTFAEGVAQYSENDPFYDEVLCLPNGCYTLYLNTNGNINPNGLDIYLNAGGEGIDYEVVPNGECCLEVQFSLNANCGEVIGCPEQLWAGPGEECGTWLFEVGSFQEGESAVWFFGDGSSEDGGHFITHHYNEPGEYIVMVEFSSNDCEGITLTTVVLVEPCEEECVPVVMTVTNPNYPDEPGFFCWNLTGINWEGSGDCLEFTEENTSISLEWCLPEDCYEVFLDLSTGDMGQNLIVEVTANGLPIELGNFQNEEYVSFSFCIEEEETNDDCPTELYAAPGEDCGLWIFEAGSFQPGETVLWTFGDDTGEQSGHFTTHVYEEPGVYTVNVIYISELCPLGTSLSTTIVVDPCDECLDVGFSFDSFVLEGGPEVITYQIFNADGILIGTEIVEYGPNQPFHDAMYCLPDGCYEVAIQASSSLNNVGFTSLPFMNGEAVEVFDLYYGENSMSYEFGINSDCQEEGCEPIVLTLSGEVDVNALISWVLSSEEYELEGEFPLELLANGELVIDWCLPSGCFALTFNSEEPFPMELLLIELYASELEEYVGEFEMTFGMNSVTFEFGVNNDCENSVVENGSLNFLIYPNPGNGILRYELPEGWSNADLMVFDNTGRLVRSERLGTNAGVLDMQNEAKGIYQLTIRSERGIAQQRLIIE